jgi:hypothetical protein
MECSDYGKSFTVNLTWLNTGSTTWTAATNYKSGSQNPQGNTTWGTARANMSGTASVAPGQSYTFQIICKAPSTVGVYNFQHKMLRENVEWFGALTPNKAITVIQ